MDELGPRAGQANSLGGAIHSRCSGRPRHVPASNSGNEVRALAGSGNPWETPDMSVTTSSSPQVICLLRAVNVGGKNKVRMAALRSALEERGLRQVESLAASGNVIVSTDLDETSLALLVEETVSDSFGVSTRCITLRPDELKSVLDDPVAAPGALDWSRQLFIVLPEVPPRNVTEAWSIHDLAGDDVAVLGRVVVQRCDEGMSKAPMVVPFIERRWETIATGRNRRTMEALRERVR